MQFEEMKELLGSAASLLQLIQFLSGALVCRKFMKKGCSDDATPFPFLCGLLSCTLWSGYGKLLDDFILIYINVVGALLMFAYIAAYYVYSRKKGYIMKIVIGIIFIIVTMKLHLSTIDDIVVKKKHLGLACSFLTIAYYSAPMADMAYVIRHKSSERLPFPLIVTSFITSLLWALYGHLIQDPLCKYINVGGFVLCSLQLSLFCLYPPRWVRREVQRRDVTIHLPEHRITISS